MIGITGALLQGAPSKYNIDGKRDNPFGCAGEQVVGEQKLPYEPNDWVRLASLLPMCFGSCFSAGSILSCLTCRYSNICCFARGG